MMGQQLGCNGQPGTYLCAAVPPIFDRPCRPKSFVLPPKWSLEALWKSSAFKPQVYSNCNAYIPHRLGRGL